MKSKKLKELRETIITFNDVGDTATVWTGSGKVYKKMLKQGFDLVEDGQVHAIFTVPKTAIKINRKRTLSPEALAKARERMKHARNA